MLETCSETYSGVVQNSGNTCINNPSMISEDSKLVSVVVITYNSSSTVIDTLDSIAAQTYPDIELVISDDGSRDDTADVVTKWLDANRSRFVSAALFQSDKNQGTIRNLNKGVRATKGEWIKSIAGDDMLKPECIERFVAFVSERPSCRMCCCDLEIFSKEPNADMSEYRHTYDKYFLHVQEPWKKQWKRIKYEMNFPGPGWFYQKTLYDEIGGFDEGYMYAEELPFAFAVLKRGIRIEPVVERLVFYRVWSGSVCHENRNTNTTVTFYDDLFKEFRKIQLPALLCSGQWLRAIELSIGYCAWRNTYHNRHPAVKALTILLFLFSPLHYVKFFQKIKKTLSRENHYW